MPKFLKNVSTVSIAPVALLALLSLAPNLFPRRSFAQATSSHSKSAHQGALAEPLVIGTDGSQTGVAKFQGNLTAISAPSGQGLVLSREPDCSLSLFTGTVSLGSTSPYTSTGLFADYDRVLHTNAGLPTTPGTSSSCTSPATGFSSRRGVYAGQTTTGIQVFAAIGYNAMLGANALVIGSGITSFTWTTLSFSAGGAVTAADLNGDGNGDLVVVNGIGTTTTAQVFVLLGNSNGTFQTAVPYTIPGAASLSAVVDDINGDGKLDIVASSDNGQISVLTGKGDGTFNSAQSFAAPAPVYPGSTLTPSTSLTNLITADLRGTHKKDIIASNGLVLLNDGGGNFTAASSAAFPPISSTSNVGPNLATGDFNNDGKLDLVVSTGGTVLTYTGKGDGTFSPGPAYTTVTTNGFVTVSDLDGDGNADIYIGEANGGFYFGDDIDLSYALMGNGDGTFSGAPAVPSPYTGSNLGDVDGDGQLDLVTPTSGIINGLPAIFTVRLGTPKGLFTPASTITLPTTIVVAGFNGPTTLSTTGASASSFAVGDLNGDGKADLAFVINSLTTAPASGLPTTFPSPVYFIALSNGDGTFATPVATTFPQIAPASGFDISLSVGSLNLGDFNHDGHNDLVFTFNEIAGSSSPVPAPYNQGFAILPGVGNGTFQSPILTTNYNSDTAPTFANLNTIVSTVDINKDGNNDLLAVTHTGTPSTGFGTHLQIFLSRGDGTFSPANIATAPNPGLNGGVPCALGDLNGDNKLDLVCTGETSTEQAQFSVSLGNGDGTFTPPTISNLTGGDTIRNSGVAIADFDGDGKPDLALINPSAASGIFYGKGDGTFTSVVNSSTVYPKDLFNLSVGTTTGGAAIALDLNKDGKPDILSGNTVLLNLYASAPTILPQANTTTTLQASATSITQGSSLTLTATVAPATGSTIPSGSILFADGETVLGSATVDATGKATFSTTALTAGSHSLTAGFAGSTTFLGSVSSTIAITVSPAVAGIATTTTLTASATTAVSGATLTFTATVTPASGTAIPTGTITFSDVGASLGAGTLDATGKAVFTTSALAVGTHTITAAYGGAATFASSTSSGLTITITATQPDFTLNLSTATATVARGATTGTTLTITGSANQSYTLTCTGAPANSNCSVGSALTLVNGNTSATIAVVFNAFVTTTASAHLVSTIQAAGLLPFGLIGSAALFAFTVRRKRNWPLPLITLVAAALLASGGCGGGGHSTTNNPNPGTYPLAISVTSGSVSHNVTFTVTVQ
jgi:hypothetical protein